MDSGFRRSLSSGRAEGRTRWQPRNDAAFLHNTFPSRPRFALRRSAASEIMRFPQSQVAHVRLR